MARINGDSVKWTKRDLVSKMAEKGYTKRVSGLVLDDVFSIIENALVSGIDVEMKGIGTFKTVVMPEKQAVSLRTGDKIMIPAHRVPKMRYSLSLKTKIRAADEKSE